VFYDRAVGVDVLRDHLAVRERARQVRALVQAVLDRVRGRTSLTDQAAYTNLCEEAARDPAVFASFKRHPDYTPVLEHVTCDDGKHYLRIALEQTPAFASVLERFRENDRLGAPQTCDYGGHGVFSPTTLRYAKVASDLTMLFGSLDALRIIEIGCGYGGQCFITTATSAPQSYTLVDLEPCLRLQQAYLSKLGVQNTRFVTAGELPDNEEYDLVVSNYAFSECVRDVQEDYLERVLRRSKRGYVTCNWVSPDQFRSLTPEDLLVAIPGSRFLPEVPLTAPDNRIWTWGAKEGTATRASGTGPAKAAPVPQRPQP
jgi:putative sugar O-methyltransferase